MPRRKSRPARKAPPPCATIELLPFQIRLDGPGVIRCACGDERCKTYIRISGRALWFTDKDDMETLMYLGPTEIVKLIHALRRGLDGIVEGRGE